MFGVELEDDGFVLVKVYCMFVNLCNLLSFGDIVVVDEVECGEDYIKVKFEDVLKDD